MKELPETPAGWTKQMQAHYNYGSKGGLGVYSISDENGVPQTHIGWQYDTRKDGLNGFTLKGFPNDTFTWAQLREKVKETISANVENATPQI
jgi:hypothetical protein